MKVAALYDIHGNLPALEAALAEIRAEGVERIVIGGDVLPGPMPRETLDRLLAVETPLAFIRGNGETAVLDRLAGRELSRLPEQAREAVDWVVEQLRAEDADRISAWPQTLRLEVPGRAGEVLFCHATPRSETEVFTRRTAEGRLLPIFADAGASLVVCGHTHMQFDRRVGSVRVINAGSVGMPFGERGAHWLLLGPRVELRRTGYDYDGAAERIRATTCPGAAGLARSMVLEPPSESEMLAIYDRSELRG